LEQLELGVDPLEQKRVQVARWPRAGVLVGGHKGLAAAPVSHGTDDSRKRILYFFRGDFGLD
jgi:hypothetical protein